MARHYIIMSSSYADGTRIALDIADEEKLTKEYIDATIKKIKQISDPDAPLSTHMLETKSSDWSSVPEYDPFFEDVKVIDTTEEFAEKIKQGRELAGIDVALYILSRIPCTHLSLEKLVYFAYAELLCETGQKLFQDKIYAFRHGPVVDGVYCRYKKSGYGYIMHPDYEKDSQITTKIQELPARSRILFAKDGIKKLRVIDRVIEKYGKLSAGQLVELTHRSGSPWSHTDSSVPYQEITDEDIIKYHHAECL